MAHTPHIKSGQTEWRKLTTALRSRHDLAVITTFFFRFFPFLRSLHSGLGSRDPPLPHLFVLVGNHDRYSLVYRVGKYFVQGGEQPQLRTYNGNYRITQCGCGKVPTRQLHIDTNCCFWSDHIRKRGDSLANDAVHPP